MSFAIRHNMCFVWNIKTFVMSNVYLLSRIHDDLLSWGFLLDSWNDRSLKYKMLPWQTNKWENEWVCIYEIIHVLWIWNLYNLEKNKSDLTIHSPTRKCTALFELIPRPLSTVSVAILYLMQTCKVSSDDCHHIACCVKNRKPNKKITAECYSFLRMCADKLLLPWQINKLIIYSICR